MDPVANEFALELRQRLAHRVKKIILFGSRARGSAHKDSDYEILLVVDERTEDVRSVQLEVAASMLEKYDALMGTIIYSEEDWHKAQGFPLAWQVTRDGIEL